MVEQLDHFQCRAWLDFLIQFRFLAGGEIGFESELGIREAATNRGGKFRGGDRRLAQSAKAEGVSAEALPCDGDGGVEAPALR